jgi:hypothetical protein
MTVMKLRLWTTVVLLGAMGIEKLVGRSQSSIPFILLAFVWLFFQGFLELFTKPFRMMKRRALAGENKVVPKTPEFPTPPTRMHLVAVCSRQSNRSQAPSGDSEFSRSREAAGHPERRGSVENQSDEERCDQADPSPENAIEEAFALRIESSQTAVRDRLYLTQALGEIRRGNQGVRIDEEPVQLAHALGNLAQRGGILPHLEPPLRRSASYRSSPLGLKRREQPIRALDGLVEGTHEVVELANERSGFA